MVNHEFRCLEHSFKVSITDPGMWSGSGLGRCALASQEVAINSEMPIDMQESTFYHELVHLIADLFDIELKEAEISALSLGFYSYIKNNKDIVGKP